MKSYVLGVKTIERIVIEMEIETPCKACKRINDDKRGCAAECPALALYRKNSVICYDKKNLDKINKKLKKLADDHAGQFTEEHAAPAEMMSESDEDGETFMADIEIDPNLNDELDIDDTQIPSEGTMTKKRKYTKKKENAVDPMDASTGAKVTDLSNTFKDITNLSFKDTPVLVLDMSKYPQIARLLKVMSEETMLPQEHIVMSFIGKGLSRE